MPKILVIQHTRAEGLGRIEAQLNARDITYELVPPGVALARKALLDARGLIVLGGPMGVYELEEHPQLADELRIIEEALRSELPFLGICLGSQLLASVLGAKVYPGAAKELGWYDVTLEPAARHDALFGQLPANFPALHWHGDVFDLPANSVCLARSLQTEHQAFRYGARAFGMLFHLEADLAQVRAMCTAFADEVRSVGQTPEDLLAVTARLSNATELLAQQVFGAFAELIVH